ncbi:metal ABC transporter substrate-binding protein [Ruminococcus sp. NK3A76]|uniref:metal ABC transporter substrate-binding protein n=1 Tax=Ruminococcus sp. NK3A76 TaxID=877411 RepID=UPI00048AF283|nr:metal ABC transporter substrate-binding protein [Ruminococcus sp. NK3A76]
MFIKKISAALTAAAIMTTTMSLAGCSDSGSSKEEGKVSIVCTIFPEYDWVKSITNGHECAEITYLLDSGADLHSYQPTAEDILKISDCDLFIYAGGESDTWVPEALENKRNDDMKIINMLDVIGDKAKEEEVKEGMQEEDEHDHDHGDEDHDHDHEEEEKEYDEHTWLSVENAKTICKEIADDLCEIDEDHKDVYKKNLESYLSELDALDSDFKAFADSAKNKTLVFGDRFPFRYFTDEYGFDYYAAFVGCSAETEASFETIAFLANKADELNAKTIFTIENSDNKIAQAIIDNTKSKDAKIAALHSLQSVTKEQLDADHTYITLMRQNLETLKTALN